MDAVYLLDINICIYIRQAKPPRVRDHFASAKPGSIAMSVVTWGELLYGAAHSDHPAKARDKLQQVAGRIPVLPLSSEVAEHYGDIRAFLAGQGKLIGANDLWIAAHARAQRLVVVTNNVREFLRVPGLQVENWAAPKVDR